MALCSNAGTDTGGEPYVGFQLRYKCKRVEFDADGASVGGGACAAAEG